LISHGHWAGDLPDYTLRQVRGYLDAIDRQEHAAFVDRLSIARAARFEKKSFMEFWRETVGRIL
jgi:hypothetical protein